MKKLKKDLTAMISSMIDHIKIWKLLTDKKDSPKAHYPNTIVPANNKTPPLEVGHYLKKFMWILNSEIISTKFYELLIMTELKGETVVDLKNLYNHITECFNKVTIIHEYLLPFYKFIKRHSEFEEYFVPDCDHPSYSCNEYTYTSLGN